MPPSPRTASPAAVDRVRLDVALVERGLVASREKAQALVVAGLVTVDGRPAKKVAEQIGPDAVLLVESRDGFVSRGGDKLDRALTAFEIDAEGLICLDAGACTGGFTDVLLRRGARRVYAVDVGRGQIDWGLRNDPRVVVYERTNVRTLTSLPEPIDLAVIDVSFISLRLVLPPISQLVRPGAPIVALVKPQFEAGRGLVGRGGIVRDPAVHRQVLLGLWAWATEHGLTPRGLVPSPIRGQTGNIEMLLWLQNQPIGPQAADPAGAPDAGPDVEALVAAALAQAPAR
jgi:23S rRNA (cytidine1920-2'-O)/16S rRNA (cytidine1409-2'-O)-methyltransferase